MAAARPKTRVRRRRPSSVDQLPQQIRYELDRLLTEGKFSIAEITSHIQGLGAAISKSAVHRYSQHQEQVAQDIRFTREMAQAVGKELQDVDGDTGRLLIESVQSLLFRARLEVATDEPLNPKTVESMARAAKDLQYALKVNVDTEAKIRDRVLKEAAEKVVKTAVAAGLSAETVNLMKSEVLGLTQ